MSDDTKIHRVRRLLASVRRLAVLTGAGISAESDVVDFAMQGPAGQILPQLLQ